MFSVARFRPRTNLLLFTTARRRVTVATRSAAGGSAGDAAEGCWSRDLALFWYAPISTPRWRR